MDEKERQDKYMDIIRNLEKRRMEIEMERREAINRIKDEGSKSSEKGEYERGRGERGQYKASSKILEMRSVEKALSRIGRYEEAETERRRADEAEEAERRLFEMNEDSKERRKMARAAINRERRDRIQESILEDKISNVNAKYDRILSNVENRIKEARRQVDKHCSKR